MRHSNISIFIPNLGCKNTCSFCNQHVISGTQSPPTQQQVKSLLSKCMSEIKNKADTEIAFFGGSFTAIPREYMISLLEVASEFVGCDKFCGIRISTRPDAIDKEILDILQKYKVTSIELGAQSMSDEVLSANNRGHSADDIRNASSLIKSYGFSLGLQMMVGLYKDTIEGAIYTANEIIKLSPDTVRIYPTVILKGTKLAELYLSGEYEVLHLDEAVKLCSKLLLSFEDNDICVIKLGLHASTDVEADMVGGIYHPAFKELCQGEIYYEKAAVKLLSLQCCSCIIEVNPTEISKMIGQNKINIEKFLAVGYKIKVVPNSKLKKYEISIKDVQNCYLNT